MKDAIILNNLYLITGDPADNPSLFLHYLERALQEGVRLVQLRAKSITPEAYQTLARESLALCRDYQAKLLLNAPAMWVSELKADGVHLTSHHLMACQDRPLAGSSYWVAASCHHRDEIFKANQIGADFIVLSPVLPTRSHPEASPLGWTAFQSLAQKALMPVFALGGLAPGDLTKAQIHGAYGIATIRGVWGKDV